MKKRKCYCEKILGRETIYIHLNGCPEDFYTKEYERMNMWQKLFNASPKSLYDEHLKKQKD